MPLTRYLPFLAVATLLLAHACTLEEDFITDSGTELTFSTDTVMFDTVFTEVGSATQSFVVYNPFDRPIEIASVRIESDPGGRFFLNVDGTSGREVTNTFLPPEDSIYVFVEVTVDPDQDLSASPFVFSGQVIIEATDVEQVVHLEAFGQNANYIPSSRLRGNFGLLTCDLGEIVWDDPKPYVLYGSLLVDSCTLTLPPGTRLYVHGGLVANAELFPDNPIFNDGIIIVQNRGVLNVEGTADNPVVIASDRLEERFARTPGQYSGIRLGFGSGPHNISHARIRHGVIGVFADSVAELHIDHTEFAYTAGAGIIGYQADITATNVISHSNGGGALQAIKGGSYQLDYCTFVNYGSQNPAVGLTNGFEVSQQNFITAPLDASIRNSIIYGSLRDELALVNFDDNTALDYRIDRSILRSTELPRQRDDFTENCTGCFFPPVDSALFANVVADTFLLDTLSVAEGRARPLPGITTDLLGRERDPETPDIGAYEYFPAQ